MFMRRFSPYGELKSKNGGDSFGIDEYRDDVTILAVSLALSAHCMKVVHRFKRLNVGLFNS